MNVRQFLTAVPAGLLGLAVLLLSAPLVLADPVGTYRVEGGNPDSGGTYQGTVEVTRTGDVYQVEWLIAGQRFSGTALGGAIVNGEFFVGPAHPDDIGLSVGYVSGDSFGIAFYVKEPDGSWTGVWTYRGSRQIAPERWIPTN